MKISLFFISFFSFIFLVSCGGSSSSSSGDGGQTYKIKGSYTALSTLLGENIELPCVIYPDRDAFCADPLGVLVLEPIALHSINGVTLNASLFNATTGVTTTSTISYSPASSTTSSLFSADIHVYSLVFSRDNTTPDIAGTYSDAYVSMAITTAGLITVTAAPKVPTCAPAMGNADLEDTNYYSVTINCSDDQYVGYGSYLTTGTKNVFAFYLKGATDQNKFVFGFAEKL